MPRTKQTSHHNSPMMAKSSALRDLIATLKGHETEEMGSRKKPQGAMMIMEVSAEKPKVKGELESPEHEMDDVESPDEEKDDKAAFLEALMPTLRRK